jgi:hypothetical protein
MANNAYPSLGGWITTVDKKCDLILVDAFASDHAQSDIFLGSVTSIQYIIFSNGQDILGAGNEIANALQKLYMRYFDAAIFSAKVTEFADKSGRHDIAITGSVVQEGRKYDFGRQLEYSNGMFVKLMTTSGAVLWTPNQAMG